MYIQCKTCSANITGTAICADCEPERASATHARLLVEWSEIKHESDSLSARLATSTALAAEQAVEIERLKSRQQELLQTIRNLSSSVPYAEEASNAATLIAEVGTLRAQVASRSRDLSTALVRAACAEDAAAGYKSQRDEYKKLAVAAGQATEIERLNGEVARLQRDEATMKLSRMLGLGDPVRPDVHAKVVRQRDEAITQRDEAVRERDFAIASEQAGRLHRDMEWDRLEVQRDEREQIAAWLDGRANGLANGLGNPYLSESAASRIEGRRDECEEIAADIRNGACKPDPGGD